MSNDRYVVIGLAKVRSQWFNNVATWAATSQVPVEFLKCVSVAEARARLTSGRQISALIVDKELASPDRNLTADAGLCGAAVLVVTDDPLDESACIAGASAILPSAFSPSTLLDALAEHSTVDNGGPADRAKDRIGAGTLHASGTFGTMPDEPGAQDEAVSFRGRLIAVTGGNGAGSSTVAMALAQGLASIAGNEGSVVLGDLAQRGDLAMYHDVRDVVPGIQELAESLRSRGGRRSSLGRYLFDIDERGYSLLLGIRRTRDWTALSTRAVGHTLDSLAGGFRSVVVDIDPEFDGASETGSSDIEERNAMSRLSAMGADLVIACGDPTLKGLHDLVRVTRELHDLGVQSSRILRVINRAPRSPKARSELTAALAGLESQSPVAAPIFLPERRHLEVTHSIADPFPPQLYGPITTAVIASLDGAVTTVGRHITAA